MSKLFSPLKLRELTLRNRTVLPPMCTYMCTKRDGVPTDWHLMHYGARAAGGFGLIIAEKTGVVPEGRITPNCCGIWNDEQTDAWSRIVDFGKAQGAAMAIQLGHAGRKASAYPDIDDLPGTAPESAGGWQPIGPSPIAFPGYVVPTEASVDYLHSITRAFADAAIRCDQAGFDAVELHAAHGYLLFQTLSPLSNQRTDSYGGSFANRTRFLLETVEAVRAVWPENKPLLVRISATEWVDGGWSLEETLELAPLLAARGVDLIDVSSGGNVPAKIAIGPGYQVNLARAVRATGVPTAAVGLITEASHAESILVEESADAICIGRAALREPSWPLRAGHALGVPRDELPYPPSYRRARY